MRNLDPTTKDKLHSLNGMPLYCKDGSDRKFLVTDLFIRRIEDAVFFCLDNQNPITDAESQKTLHQFRKLINNDDACSYLQFYIAHHLLLKMSEDFPATLGSENANTLTENSSCCEWLRDAVDLCLYEKGSRKPICHNVNQLREVLYTEVMQVYVDHTRTKATTTEHSIFWTIMDLVVSDPTINLQVKDHKPHIRKAIEIMEINDLYPADLIL